MNDIQREDMDFSKKKRYQTKGWSHGKLTKKRLTSINLDQDVGEVLDKKSKDSGQFVGRIINDSLRSHFGMSF